MILSQQVVVLWFAAVLLLCWNGHAIAIAAAFSPHSSFLRPSSLHPLRPPRYTNVPLYMGQRGKRIKREKRKALREPTPPRIQTPYGPIRLSKPPRTCECCSGRGMVRCNVCQGRGVIRKTGARKTNAVQLDRVVGTKWTSVEVREGHRQYRVTEVRGSTKGRRRSHTHSPVELRMSNCCGDPVDFWIPLAELKNKSVWRMGWTTLKEIRQADGGALLDVRLCFRCKGERILTCVECGGEGMIESYEPLHN